MAASGVSGRSSRTTRAGQAVTAAGGRALAAEQVAALRRVDGWLLTIIVSLCAFGLVMVYSASEALGYLWMGNANYFFERQVVGLVFGVVLGVGAARLDYHVWRRFTRPLAIGTLVMLVLVLVPHLGSERYGARRWFALGPLSVQPSAIAVVVGIILFSRWLTDRGPLVRTWRGVRDYGVLLGALLALILLEKDLGSTIVIACVGVVLLGLAGARKAHLAFVVSALAGAGWLMVRMEAYRSSRLASFRDPFADPLNTGFQSVQALFALGSGGLRGVGLGNSIQKYQWLPEAHTDFIFAIIGEELGFLGTMAVIVTFVLFAWRGIRASLRAPDTHGALLAGGITAWICVQAFINIAAVTNVVPTTGIPLPFLSYGGTSLAMTLVAVGVLCNVSSQGRDYGGQRRAHVDSWRGDRRTPDTRSRRRTRAAPR